MITIFSVMDALGRVVLLVAAMHMCFEIFFCT
jgi:hypothetical protein